MAGTGEDGAIRSGRRALVTEMACSRVDCMRHLSHPRMMINFHICVHLSYRSFANPPTPLQADAASSSCDSPTCRSSFGLFTRRHHCRHCGHVFCYNHTPHLVPLDQNARFHPEGVLSRACDLCWSAYQRWEETRTDRLNKIQSNIDAKNDETTQPAEEDLESSENSGRAALKPNLGQPTEVAASVPRDWNWSTF